MSSRMDARLLAGLPKLTESDVRVGLRVVWVSSTRPGWIGAVGTVVSADTFGGPVVQLDSPVRHNIHGRPVDRIEGYFAYRWAVLPGCREDTA